MSEHIFLHNSPAALKRGSTSEETPHTCLSPAITGLVNEAEQEPICHMQQKCYKRKMTAQPHGLIPFLFPFSQ